MHMPSVWTRRVLVPRFLGLVLLGVAGLCTHVARAADQSYLAGGALDLMAILPPPPPEGSPAQQAQAAQIVALQRGATEARIAQARADADESVFAMFGNALGPAFRRADLPATARLFDRIAATEETVVRPAKAGFAERRPFQANPEIKALTRASPRGSYPSGHATRVTAFAIVLGDLLPAHRPALWARAGDYALSRVIGGVHYPHDIEAGGRAGTAIAVALRGNAAFVEDFDAARRELAGLPANQTSPAIQAAPARSGAVDASPSPR